MLKSLEVDNFRCYKRLEISDLRRVNVVVGRNAAGKTALLEAIRLGLGGTPSVLWGMNPSRGWFGGITQPVTRESFEALWNSYFYNFNSSNPILTKCTNSESKSATVRIFYDVKTPVTVVPQQPGSPVLPSIVFPSLAFDRTDFTGNQSTLYASIQPQGAFNFDNGPELGPVTEFFPSSAFAWGGNAQLPTQLFSQVSSQKKERALVNAVRDEFESSLEDLSVLAPAGSQQASLYANLKYLREKIPIGYLSSGISRFVTMLSAVLIRGKGVVLIDEIENGLSYKIFESLWKYLLKFAEDNDTQIFASTHSKECVQALLPSLKGHEQEFSLIRTERINGASGVAVISGDLLESAIIQGVEVR